jgi:hypothetical protein
VNETQTNNVVGKIVKLLGKGRAVANIGLEASVRPGDVFAIFELGDEILDPESGDSLGVLEMVKGTVVAEHVQPRLTQLGPPPETATVADTRVLSAQMADPAAGNMAATQRRQPIRVGDRIRRISPT